MNRVYKVIYNRARNLYQVVSEIVHSRGKTKSLTAQHQHERLTTAILIALFAMGTSLPVGWAADAKVDASNIGANLQPADGITTVTDDEKESNEKAWGTAIGLGAVDPKDSRLVSGTTMYNELRSGMTSTNTIAAGNTVAKNLSALDQAIAAETTARTTADTDLSKKIGALDANGNYLQKDASISSNLSTLDTQVKSNTDAIAAETTARTTADTDLSKKIGALDANGNYLQKDASISSNLSTLDTQIKNVIDAIGLDPDNTTTSYTSKLNKYFKVNPKVTTTDTTTTYDPDAAANGTNSVAIGPNAKTATYTTTVTSGDSTTTTETAADHAVAIGDGATVNAAGDQGIALGKGAVTGEAEASTLDGTTTTTTDAKGGESSVAIGDTTKANGNQAIAFGSGASVLNPTGTAVSTGSTAIGSGAKVDGGSNSIALGTSAVVNTVSDAMALGNGATINKTATGSIAIGKAAVTGGADKPITLTNGTTGTLAAAGGVDSIAIGNGAVSEGNEALALGKGAKVTNEATGGDSAAAIVKTGSAAIGDGAAVTNSDTSMAIGNGASITEGENTTVIGSGAKAAQTK